MKNIYTHFLSQVGIVRPRIQRADSPGYVIDNSCNTCSPIRCLSPTIILRSDWYNVFKTHPCVELYYSDGSFRRFNFGGLRRNMLRFLHPSNITHDFEKIDLCFFIDEHTGEVEPVYIVVPCQHCRLCRERKANELAFRCCAEDNLYQVASWFITFTYSDAFLPKNGLEKRDPQLMLKRLRRMLDVRGIQHNLRYFLRGEYGSKYGRPHYHMILFNFPQDHFPNVVSVAKFIERAWSVLHKDENGKRVKVNGSYLYAPLGFIKVLPVEQGCTGYVMKYLRKECPNKKNYPNPDFYSASCKGGGLGAAYFRTTDFLDAVKNPVVTSLTFLDKKNSTPDKMLFFHTGITPYIKSKIFPSPSNILPRKKYLMIQRYLAALTDLRACFLALDLVVPREYFDFAEKLENFSKEFLTDDELEKLPYSSDLDLAAYSADFLLRYLDHQKAIILKVLDIDALNKRLNDAREWKRKRGSFFDAQPKQSFDLVAEVASLDARSRSNARRKEEVF